MQDIENAGYRVAVPTPMLVSVKVGAAQCGIGLTLFNEWLKNGTIRSLKIGRRRLVDYASVLELLDRCRETQAADRR